VSERPQAGHHVLIVEDSRTQAERLRYYLERNGFAVASAVNGREALDLLKESLPSLIVSDVVMPEMDGYELCRCIRRDTQLAGVPVILLSALTGATDVIDGLASGATDFLVKPYTEEALIARISRALTNRDLRDGATSKDGVEVWFAGRQYTLDSDRTQSVDFLLSSFEDAIDRNERLNEANAQLTDALKRISTLERRFQNLMEFSPAGLLVVGSDGVIWYANQAAEKLFRKDAEELKGTHFPFALHEGVATEVTLALPGHDVAIAELQVVETTWGDSPARLVSMWDVTENVGLRKQLEELSLTDELTGLANRRGFMLLAEQQRKLVARGHAMVLLYMDLNDFKSINDTLGHAAGDEALAETARLLGHCVRDSDILARMGGDEFAALLVDAQATFVHRAPRRVQEVFAERNSTATSAYDLSISIGAVSYLGEEPCTLEELIGAADGAMYKDKQRMKAGAAGPLSRVGAGRRH
jgi:two-component system cell cycle response regulator